MTDSNAKLKFDTCHTQSRMVEGACVPDGDYDELLREAVRLALRMDVSQDCDDWHVLYDRIRTLMDAYVASPDGVGEGAATLLSRFAACISDVIPLAIRKVCPSPQARKAKKCPIYKGWRVLKLQ
jgi:hypothetical protein